MFLSDRDLLRNAWHTSSSCLSLHNGHAGLALAFVETGSAFTYTSDKKVRLPGNSLLEKTWLLVAAYPSQYLLSKAL